MRKINKTISKDVATLLEAPKGKLNYTVYSNKDLAKIIGVSDQTISNWRKSGILQSSAPGHCIYNLEIVLENLKPYLS